MITFNIDYNERLVDFIYVARWSYYRRNNELLTRIFNVLQDLTQGSFDSGQLKDIIAQSVKFETARIKNDGFVVKSMINECNELKIAVFEHNKNFETIKSDINPSIEQTIREQFSIE